MIVDPPPQISGPQPDKIWTSHRVGSASGSPRHFGGWGGGMHLTSLLFLAFGAASNAFSLNGPTSLLAKSSGCPPLSFPACKQPLFSLPGLPSATGTRWTDQGIFGPSEGIGLGFLLPHVDRSASPSQPRLFAAKEASAEAGGS